MTGLVETAATETEVLESVQVSVELAETAAMVLVEMEVDVVLRAGQLVTSGPQDVMVKTSVS